MITIQGIDQRWCGFVIRTSATKAEKTEMIIV